MAKHELIGLGQRVAFLREDAGLTVEQLAEKANVDVTTLAWIEDPQSKAWPSVQNIERIADALEITLRQLFRGMVFEVYGELWALVPDVEE